MTDRLGLENNEAGWLVGWVMECYEKGYLTKDDIGGLEMKWGNVEAVRQLLHMTAHRQGFGDLLAEGVMRASQRIG
ncbi:MAG: aldehyde ferredoxin oxidoreductase, partial [Nitrososphaeria archaeon]|nr:aldehyde ferredoxin oxidoreductase [Nitrososphaeria archaeon]